jgi:hypothetical protein
MKIQDKWIPLTKEEKLKLSKIVDKCEFYPFDQKAIEKKIARAYKLRDQAHEMLLQADVLLDEVLTKMYGHK